MSYLDSICLAVRQNSHGWGPNTTELSFTRLQFVNASPDLIVTRSDQFGHTSDWSSGLTQDRRTGSQFNGRSKLNDQLAAMKPYEEGPHFHYVQAPRNKRIPGVQRSLKHKLQQQKVIQMQKQQREEKMQASTSQNVRQRKLREREVQKAEKKWFKNFGSRYQHQKHNNIRKIAPSVEIKHTWQLLREIEFSSLNKLNVNVDSPPEDLKVCGSLEHYDTTFDRITPKTAVKLLPTDRVSYKTSTTSDPVMNEMIENSMAQVYATDSIIATLMTCTRSVYPWDIVLTRKNSCLFFDKREKSNFDMLTVNENSSDPPQDFFNLSSEATLIDKYFSQQVLKRDKTVSANNINPFYDEASKQPLAPILYRYRRWQLKEVPVIIRCEVNAMLGENIYCNVRTLNEYDPKITDDWRRKLELQKGAVIATELKNNSSKLAKCTISSILSGCDLIKLGYVTRDNFYTPKSHVILGTQDFIPSFLASQVSLELNNCWGVLYVLIQECLKLEDGKYFLVRDSTKHVLKLYQTSGESDDVFDFENDDSDSNSNKSCND